MSKNYAVIRVEPIASRSDLVMASKHGRRQDRSPHVDRTRSHLNKFWIPPGLGVDDPSDLVGAVDALANQLGATFHAGAAVAANFHASVSGEYFLEEGEANWNVEKISDWYRRVGSAFQRKFPNQVAQVRLDLDEQTPHLAIVVLPIYTKKTKHTEQVKVSYRKVFGGDRDTASARMIDLQDWYAGVLAPLGIERGVPFVQSGRQHQTHQVYRRTESAKAAALQLAIEQAEAERTKALELRGRTEADLLAATEDRAKREFEWQMIAAGAERIVALLADDRIAMTAAGSKVSVPAEDWEAVRPAIRLMAPIIQQFNELAGAMRSRMDELDTALADLESLRDRLTGEQQQTLAHAEEVLGFR